MRKAPMCIGTILLATALVWAQKAPKKPPSSARVSIAKAIPDLAKGPVDPYEATGERAKFFKAAGKDSELDQKECEANRKVKDGFVRKFDRWETYREVVRESREPTARRSAS